MSPFKAAYGRKPPSMLDYVPMTATTKGVNRVLLDRQALLQAFKVNLAKAQATMKKFADGQCRELSFAVGDLVLLKLQSYRQQLVVDRSNQKLSARYFGPFKILKCIGKVAYQLELPATTRIHDVFHVSLLKPYKGSGTVAAMTLPPYAINIHPVL